MLPILFDVLVVAILLFFTLRGVKKGFVLTLCSLVAVLVAIIGANIVADVAGPMVADAIQPKLERTIEDTLRDKAEGLALSWADDLSTSDVLASLKEKGGIYEYAANSLEDAGWSVTEFILSDNDGISRAAATVAATIAAQLARGIIFIIAFVLISIAWWILSHTLDLVTKLPVLDTLNSGLGGGIGLVKGVVIAYVAVWCLYSLSGYVSPEVMERTYLFRFLALHSPLELLHLT